MELGVYTFAEVPPDRAGDGGALPGERIRDLLEEIELADQLGLDVFGVGEAPPPITRSPGPAVVLAAAADARAARTDPPAS